MELLQREQRERAGSERGPESLTIGLNRFALVPFGEPKVQDAFAGIENAVPTRTRAEAVHQPGKVLEGGEFENLHAAHGAQRPGGSNSWGPRWEGVGPAGLAFQPATFSCGWHPLSII